MSIQENVNRTIGGIAAIAGISGIGKEAAELRSLNEGKERAEMAQKIAAEAGDINAALEYKEEATGLKKKIFEINPQPETFREYRDSRPTEMNFGENTSPRELQFGTYRDETRRKRAAQRLEEQKTAATNQMSEIARTILAIGRGEK